MFICTGGSHSQLIADEPTNKISPGTRGDTAESFYDESKESHGGTDQSEQLRKLDAGLKCT